MSAKIIQSKSYIFIAIMVLLATQSCTSKSQSIILSCNEGNDLYRTLKENRIACIRYDTPEEAINSAATGSGVLILADGYPNQTTLMDSSLFEETQKKGLRLYIEYPSYIPAVETGMPRGTQWERAVVSSDAFAPELDKLKILAIHDCRFIPIKASNPDIVMARVAGFDSAVYGLPEETFPVLTKIGQVDGNGGILVSTTKLSQFITGRYAPYYAWIAVWKHILEWAEPDKKIDDLQWTVAVRPTYSADEQLPEDAEIQALKRGIAWYFNSRMIISQNMMAKYELAANGPEPAKANPDPLLDWPYGHRVGIMPDLDTPVGDGSLGVMEGFDAKIFYNGTQPVKWWRRNDCNGEVAGTMSVASLVLNNADYLSVGSKIGENLYFKSPMSLGDRLDSQHPAYGLFGWNDVPEYCGPGTMNGYEVYYNDDNARAALGIILSASILKTDQYNERLSKNLCGLLRITNRKGFFPHRVNQSALEKHGWQRFHNDTTTNFVSSTLPYVWAYYLWAYSQTGYVPFLTQARNGITTIMKTYPDHDIWTNGSRARWLLPLSWLIKVDDIPIHRKWLNDMAGDLKQEPGGAIIEEMPKTSWGNIPKSNEEYGTDETTLLQTTDDRVSDLLYTANFAFIGLHEAAKVLNDNNLKEMENKLAEFICRVQIRSEKHPELDGGWFRAFDLRQWEYWASNADIGWGAWCIETGWSQSWINIVLALRQLNTSFWDVIANSNIKNDFGRVRKEMLPDEKY